MGKNTVKNRMSFYKKRFLINFVKYGGRVGEAAHATGVARSTVYKWLEGKEFKELFEDARRDAVEILEKEAQRRAIHGVDKPVFYKGEKCGAVREFSDTLLIVLLKANAPEKYRELHEITGPGGGPIKHEAVATFKFIMPDGQEKTAGEMLENTVKR